MQPNIIERVWRQDKMVNVDVLNGFTFTDEEEAHRFIISGKNVNTPVNISGTVTANFKNADNVLVPLTGTIEDGKAVVVLSQECYAVEGPFSLMIFADTVCIYAAIANVINSSGEVIAYPTAAIPSVQELIEEVQDVIASIPQDYSTLNQSVQDLKSAFETVYTRKNLFPINGGAVTVNGVTVSYSDGVLAVNGLATASGGRLEHIIDIILPAGTYTFTRTPTYVATFLEKTSDDSIIVNLNTATQSGTFTLASETECYIGVNVISGTDYNYSMDVQIENGNESTTIVKPSNGTAIDKTARESVNSILSDISNNIIPTTLAGTLFPADLNNAEIGRASRYAGTAINAPNNKQGTVFTLKGTNDTGVQIAFDSDGAIYKRVYWGDWGAWEYVNTLTSTTIISDYNNAVVNKVNRVTANANNAPSANEANVVTFQGGGDNRFQIAVDTADHMYTRIFWGSAWMPWKSYVEARESQYTFDVSPASISSIPKIGVIGDSFASGEIKVNGSFIDIFSQSWIQIIARKNGITAYNFSQGGLTAKEWMNTSTTNGIAKLLATEKCNLYLIVLGINENKSSEAVGTIEDIGSSADTFYRYYSDIISTIQTYNSHAKIIVVKGSTNSSADWQRINTAMQNIADHFEIPTIAEYNDPFFTSAYFTTLVNGHPTTSSYGGMANALQRMIEDCMATEYEYFYDVNYPYA